jgi:hypothetical protein
MAISSVAFTIDMNGTNGTSGNSAQPKADSQKQSVNDDPDKFLLFAITALLITPSHYNHEVAHDGQLIRNFLKLANVDNRRHDKIVNFSNSIRSDFRLVLAMKTVSDLLQTDIGNSNMSYAPTPCPDQETSRKIIEAMATL